MEGIKGIEKDNINMKERLSEIEIYKKTLQKSEERVTSQTGELTHLQQLLMKSEETVQSLNIELRDVRQSSQASIDKMQSELLSSERRIFQKEELISKVKIELEQSIQCKESLECEVADQKKKMEESQIRVNELLEKTTIISTDHNHQQQMTQLSIGKLTNELEISDRRLNQKEEIIIQREEMLATVKAEFEAAEKYKTELETKIVLLGQSESRVKDSEHRVSTLEDELSRLRHANELSFEKMTSQLDQTEQQIGALSSIKQQMKEQLDKI